jgi:hypothetical protein
MKNYNNSTSENNEAILEEDSINSFGKDLVDTFEEEVMEILYAIDSSESFVTDNSKINDLIPVFFSGKQMIPNQVRAGEIIFTINSLFKNTSVILPTDKLGEVARNLNSYRKNKIIG